MNNMLKKLKNKKGFTLVEVIVVIVIIAILTAVLLPSLTGYIKEANDTAAMAEARTAYAGLQTVASLHFANPTKDYLSASDGAVTLKADGYTKLNALVSNGNDFYASTWASGKGTIESIELENSKVVEFVYASSSGLIVTLKDGAFEVTGTKGP
ncbi:prepilin-type N-terminal cleavage/methylation domain-containing protein [Eubacteriales bacterium OttesenSCG-928-K08]|nr:prepilin-type N-terminal cleavage/methylation domain-containing protein [Eubacteriales bacterium OttesenSCG-928-K08]